MNLAVQFFATTTLEERALLELPDTLPNIWPVLVIELGEEEEVPAGFVLMTTAEYAQYRANHMAEYLASQHG